MKIATPPAAPAAPSAPAAPIPAPTPTPTPTPAPTPAPTAPQLPPPLAIFSYVRATPASPAGEKVDAPAYPFQLMPGAAWVIPDGGLYESAGSDFAIALKVAHARAGAALSNQSQMIMKDAKDGVLYISGTAHPFQQSQADGTSTTSAMPTFIDGTDFASVMKSVSVTKNDPDVQAIVGANGFIDLRAASTGTEQPFPAR